MKDFVRISGEITSSPLNENFRRLRNDISISNTNLIFSNDYGIKMTIEDMQNIPAAQKVDGLACYVVSSGELYRYSNNDTQWHKIADFGQTFRQAFLNSGVVALQHVSQGVKSYITKKDSHTLTIPEMLVYFKTLPGDEKYLKGMYHINETDIDVSTAITTSGAYSIYLNGSEVSRELETNTALYTVSAGMPTSDNPNAIYIGGFLIDDSNTIIDDFIYTIPDIAYTADRGFFYLTGGQVTGCHMKGNGTNNDKVMGVAGKYYDEGINVPQGELDNFPIDSFNGSNYNLRTVGAEQPLSKLYYAIPVNPLGHEVVNTQGSLLYDKYYDTTAEELKTVEPGQFTIQRHLITPCGSDCTDIMLYGTAVYNSMEDALSNINAPGALELVFPYVEVTRVIVGRPLIGGNFNADDEHLCRFNTLERLSQVGTFEPKFADTDFMIYSGDLEDPTPSHFRFSLDYLQDENYDSDYILNILPYNTTRYKFGINQKYITDSSSMSVDMTESGTRKVNNIAGYNIADEADLTDVRTRLGNIESEIWHVYDNTKQIYEQSIRYRLFHLEDRVSTLESEMDQAQSDIHTLYKTKVHKNTTINGYKLGDDLTSEVEAKTFALQTGDIAEGNGLGSSTNLWYTDARVNANSNVNTAYTHANKRGSGTTSDANPHGMSLDDITDGTTHHTISTTDQNKIANLPANTISELATLENDKIESILIKKVDGSSTTTTGTETTLGNIKTLRFFDSGANITIAGDMATIECTGQMDQSIVMFKSDYATLSVTDPTTYAGTVDKAAQAFAANHIYGITTAGNSKYYGTNSVGTPGIYSLPVYVASADASSYATIDGVTFQPIAKSVRLAHLGDSTVTYTSADEEYTLGTNLHDLVVNHYHKAYDSATLKSSEINEWNFGNNLTVTVDGHRATINASGSGSGGVSEFASLDDVSVTYSDANVGKMLVLDKTNDVYKIKFASTPATTDYMLKSTYVSTTNPLYVKLAEQATQANTANSATTALTLQSAYSVNDGGLTDTDLWSADRIIEYVTDNTPDTYSGTTVPSSSLGKDGDIYILIES